MAKRQFSEMLNLVMTAKEFWQSTKRSMKQTRMENRNDRTGYGNFYIIYPHKIQTYIRSPEQQEIGWWFEDSTLLYRNCLPHVNKPYLPPHRREDFAGDVIPQVASEPQSKGMLPTQSQRSCSLGDNILKTNNFLYLPRVWIWETPNFALLRQTLLHYCRRNQG